MKVKQHILSSLPLGVGYFLISKDLLPTLLAMASTVVIDADHFLDYVITQKRIDSLKEVAEAFSAFEVVHTQFLILHSWELIVLAACVLYIYPNLYLTAILVGCAYHLLFDQIYNTLFLGKYNLRIPSYFFFYRMTYNFDVRLLRQKGGYK